jgi:hypothetical protein
MLACVRGWFDPEMIWDAAPSGKQRAKSVPPKSNRLRADVDAAFVQQILHVPKRQWKMDIHHHGQTDDLWPRLEVAKRAAFCHPTTLNAHPARLNRFCSDSSASAINLSFSEWATVFGDGKMPTALLDRLKHRCHILQTGNDSYRFKASSEIAKKKRRETPALTTS